MCDDLTHSPPARFRFVHGLYSVKTGVEAHLAFERARSSAQEDWGVGLLQEEDADNLNKAGELQKCPPKSAHHAYDCMGRPGDRDPQSWSRKRSIGSHPAEGVDFGRDHASIRCPSQGPTSIAHLIHAPMTGPIAGANSGLSE